MRPSTTQTDQPSIILQHSIPDSSLPIPPPLISTPSSSTTPSPALATAINTATRPLHTTLNRLIIARLPLALPPITSTPFLYTIGLTAFAPIYTTFEAAWTAALSSSSTRPLSPELHAALRSLYDPRIRRTETLNRDLIALQILLLTRAGEKRRQEQDELELLDTTERHLNTSFKTHIRSAIAARPHVVVAYAWVMYMALFSGGRWIRMVLREAGPEFWGHARSEQQERTNQGDAGLEAGYSFLMFDGDQDGEDVKAAFKAQLAKVEAVMSEEQREEVVQEARYIFQACIELVEELDARLATLVETRSESEGKRTKESAANVTEEVMVTANKMTRSGIQTTAAPILLALALVLIFITVLEPLKKLVAYTGFAYSYDKR